MKFLLPALPVFVASFLMATFLDGSYYGVALTVGFLMCLYTLASAIHHVIGMMGAKQLKERIAFSLLYFGSFYFFAVFFVSFYQYFDGGTLMFGETPFVVAGDVTLWGYLYAVLVSQVFGIVTVFFNPR